MSTLDKSKPFGEVFGSQAGIRYEQGGKLFNAQCQEVDSNGTPVASGKKSEPEAVSVPDAQAQPAEPKPAAKKGSGKKSEPEGVKPLREQSKEDGQ